ncbi:MAG: TolC family protein, partial [Candidatus Brocadiae bacterium]|nr:TolC family protein [Candidatus Brocadiia bacterium]
MNTKPRGKAGGAEMRHCPPESGRPRSDALALLACLAALAVLTGCAVKEGGLYADEGQPGIRTAQWPPIGRRVGPAEAAPLPESPSVEDYVAYAALGNPGLQAAFNRWKAALERVPQAEALAHPRFTYRYFIREVETRVGPQEQGFALAQTLPWFGKLALRGGRAWEAAEAARMRYEMEKLRLFYQVKDAYYEYYHLGRAIAVVGEQFAFVKYIEEVLRARYRAAASQHADVIRAQVELGKLDDRLRALKDLQQPVVARLNAALNRPLDAPLPWPTEIAQKAADATDEEILAWLPVTSPELREFEHRIAREEYGIRLARKGYYPDVTVGLGYIDTGSSVMATRDSSKDPVVATVSVNLPVWFRKLEAGVREAEALKRAAVSARRERANSLGSRVKMVLYKFRDAERKINLYRDTLIPKGKQSLNASQTAFRAGTASFLDLVDAIRMLLEFELAYEGARVERAQRLAE